jgi:DNA polymerase-3 subunit delta
LAEADAAIETALNEGLNGVGLVRAALSHLQKLHQARLQMAGGMSAADAVGIMRPPVFYKAKPVMTASLSLWSEEALLAAIAEARTVETGCKQTGSRPELLARRYIAWLARQGQARASTRG